jgi:Na+/H+-translocating membrane pyrophosphatase
VRERARVVVGVCVVAVVGAAVDEVVAAEGFVDGVVVGWTIGSVPLSVQARSKIARRMRRTITAKMSRPTGLRRSSRYCSVIQPPQASDVSW